MGNGMREGSFCPSLPLSVRTLFSPPLAFPHSAAPASASPPLHGLPTPPLSRGEGEVGAGVGSGGGGRQGRKSVRYREQLFTSNAVGLRFAKRPRERKYVHSD